MQKLFQTLIHALSETLGAPLEIAEGTRVNCNFDQFPVLIQYLPDAEQLLLAAPVAEVPSENREALYRELLHGQYLFRLTGGGALSLDENARFVCLQAAKDIRSLTPENFVVFMENFLHIAEYWHKRCLESGPSASAAAPTGVENNASMLRV
ncbi:MAG: type III secretion system chaperone [Zoogloeaceae bacterium]|jgi:hypothetical protein|nr:type III secretion system chaperone [Zoogloeaceae bacterium]